MSKVVYSDSFYSFLEQSDCRIAKILFKAKNRYWRNYDNIITTSEVNYITFRHDGTISFLPNGKDHLVDPDTGTWKREGRQNGKPGKIIRKLFTDRAIKLLKLKDADFECFTNNYKATFNDDGYSMELLPNKKIPFVYDMDIAQGNGSLNGSCMNGDSEYLDIYKYCDKLQILILKNKDGLLCGRSLIWTVNADITLMDRIYVTQDFMFDKFLAYATEKGFWRKREYRSYDYKTTFINPQGEEIRKKFTISTNTDFEYYPYIDTFSFGNDGSLTNDENDYCYSYNNTDGTRSGENHEDEIYDEINGCYIHEDDAVYIEHGERRYRYCHCHIDNCVNVNDNWYHEDDENIICIKGNWYEKDSDEICVIDDEYYLMDDCVYCERDNTYYLQEDCVFCENDSEDVLRSEAVEINGIWYHEDSDSIVKIGDNYYEKDSDEIVKIGHNYYLLDDIRIVKIDNEYRLRQLTLFAA